MTAFSTACPAAIARIAPREASITAFCAINAAIVRAVEATQAAAVAAAEAAAPAAVITNEATARAAMRDHAPAARRPAPIHEAAVAAAAGAGAPDTEAGAAERGDRGARVSAGGRADSVASGTVIALDPTGGVEEGSAFPVSLSHGAEVEQAPYASEPAQEQPTQQQ